MPPADARTVLGADWKASCPISVCRARTRPFPREGDRCFRCGSPIGPFINNGRDCVRCRRDRFHFERVIRLGIYQSALRNMCLASKRSEELAAALAGYFWQREEATLRGAKADLVIPIPHHWRENLGMTTHAPGDAGGRAVTPLASPLWPPLYLRRFVGRTNRPNFRRVGDAPISRARFACLSDSIPISTGVASCWSMTS